MPCRHMILALAQKDPNFFTSKKKELLKCADPCFSSRAYGCFVCYCITLHTTSSRCRYFHPSYLLANHKIGYAHLELKLPSAAFGAYVLQCWPRLLLLHCLCLPFVMVGAGWSRGASAVEAAMPLPLTSWVSYHSAAPTPQHAHCRSSAHTQHPSFPCCWFRFSLR